LGDFYQYVLQNVIFGVSNTNGDINWNAALEFEMNFFEEIQKGKTIKLISSNFQEFIASNV